MKNRIVLLSVSSPNHEEALAIVAKDFNEFCQRLYAWLNHEKIGSEFRLVNNTNDDADIYWLDAGNSKEGFVSISLNSCSPFGEEEEIKFANMLVEKSGAEIFTNEQEHPLVSPEKAMQLNAFKELESVLVPYGFNNA